MTQRPGRALPAGHLPAAAAVLQAHFMTDNNDKLLPNLKVLDFADMPEILGKVHDAKRGALLRCNYSAIVCAQATMDQLRAHFHEDFALRASFGFGPPN